MLVSDAFPSNYVKAADLQNKAITVTIDSVDMQSFANDPKKKPVLHFVGRDKALILNKTNARNIQIVYGDDMDEWLGREIILYPTSVDFQGRTVEAIRVRVPKIGDRQSARAAAAGSPSAPAALANELSDEIPF